MILDNQKGFYDQIFLCMRTIVKFKQLTLRCIIILYLDLNECLLDDACDTNAKCTDTIGSFDCNCNNGFYGNGSVCMGE